MRWPRPRVTIRRLMVAVAVVALGLGAYLWVAEMRARSVRYQRRAIDFEVSAMHAGSWVILPDGRYYDRYEDENDQIQDAYARRMAEKYRHLAIYPWKAVEPDPPRPARLANPRRGEALAKRFEPDDPDEGWHPPSGPPAWTFLWTRPWGRW